MANQFFDDLPSDLSAAFEERDAARENESESEQESEAEVENPSEEQGQETDPTPDETSRSDSRTAQDSETTPKDVDPLQGLELAAILKHPVLGKQVQAWKDSEAAKQNTGLRERIRQEEAERLKNDTSKEFFSGLDEDELTEALKDPQVREEYVRVQSLPEPPPPEVVQAKTEHYASLLRVYTPKLDTLSDADKVRLNPNTYLLDTSRDPDELIGAWMKDVDDAVVAARVSKEVEKVSKPKRQADELDRQAQDDEERERDDGLVLDRGRRVPPIPDLITTNGDDLLADAFHRVAVAGGRRRR